MSVADMVVGVLLSFLLAVQSSKWISCFRQERHSPADVEKVKRPSDIRLEEKTNVRSTVAVRPMNRKTVICIELLLQ